MDNKFSNLPETQNQEKNDLIEKEIKEIHSFIENKHLREVLENIYRNLKKDDLFFN